MKKLQEKTVESLKSILPISVIVLILSVTVAPIGNGILTLFLFGMIFLIFGMGLFTLGSEMSMQPLGEGIGVQISKTKFLPFALVLCFVLGAIVTIAEPDLQVLAEQISSVPSWTLILFVAAGVGLFLLLSLLRVVFKIKLSVLLLICYPIIFILAIVFAPKDFIPAAFDSGGVTTGPITVPFIMAMGAGMAALRSDKHSKEDSFGLIALCSIGPILSVIILSIFYNSDMTSEHTVITEAITTKEAFEALLHEIPLYAKEVLLAIAPIFAVFVIFELFTRRFNLHGIIRILVGMLYTYVGLVLFLTGANVGFMPMGRLLGETLGNGNMTWILVPVGALIGYFVVAAEPAVIVLKKQVEEISNGAITASSVGIALAVGVSVSVGLSMLRVLTGIPLIPFLVVGYGIALVISFFVPGLYTGVAFDSGGVASGPMTTTFILPFALGACESLGGNAMTDAFGIVAMVAMTPLITIQVLGLAGNIRTERIRRKHTEDFEKFDDCIIYYDREDDNIA